jgi:hypothetical protein
MLMGGGNLYSCFFCLDRSIKQNETVGGLAPLEDNVAILNAEDGPDCKRLIDYDGDKKKGEEKVVIYRNREHFMRSQGFDWVTMQSAAVALKRGGSYHMLDDNTTKTQKRVLISINLIHDNRCGAKYRKALKYLSDLWRNRSTILLTKGNYL